MASIDLPTQPAIGLLPVRTDPFGHRGAIVWLTGLSGSGKTTLARALEQQLLASGLMTVVLDGDELRRGVSQGLGYSLADRRESIRRAAEVALHLAEAGAVVLVAHISPLRDTRMLAAERFRARGVPFAEVFVSAPITVCEQRDPKGLYQKARAGQIVSFTGIDSPYEMPTAPDLEIRTDLEPIADSVAKITPLALQLADLSGAERVR
jgi:adenylyl-sulfate kinase